MKVKRTKCITCRPVVSTDYDSIGFQTQVHSICIVYKRFRLVAIINQSKKYAIVYVTKNVMHWPLVVQCYVIKQMSRLLPEHRTSATFISCTSSCYSKIECMGNASGKYKLLLMSSPRVRQQLLNHYKCCQYQYEVYLFFLCYTFEQPRCGRW